MKRCLRCHAGFNDDNWTCPACSYAPAASGDILVFAPALADGDGSDADYRYERLAAAQSSHFWFVRRARLLAWALQRYFPSARTFLEVGCGTGGVSAALQKALPALHITAGDTRLAGLEYAKRSAPTADIVQCQASELPFESEFDVAGAFDVIEHIDDDIGALTALRDVVKPGGGVMITVPQHRWLWSEVDEFSHHRRRYIRAELQSKLASVGLELLRMTSFASVGLPILWLSRHLPRRFDPEREVRISPAANAVLGWLSGFEQRLIMAGFSPPAGGSLLAVAKRTT
ncbi:MAG TPA: class I SAM-dependent methyltransferase [Vicinamibacterales bacterium]|nr:class I SAM-dependent methyltransferase [Vicinamibacterales bacterium]